MAAEREFLLVRGSLDRPAGLPRAAADRRPTCASGRWSSRATSSWNCSTPTASRSIASSRRSSRGRLRARRRRAVPARGLHRAARRRDGHSAPTRRPGPVAERDRASTRTRATAKRARPARRSTLRAQPADERPYEGDSSPWSTSGVRSASNPSTSARRAISFDLELTEMPGGTECRLAVAYSNGLRSASAATEPSASPRGAHCRSPAPKPRRSPSPTHR